MGGGIRWVGCVCGVCEGEWGGMAWEFAEGTGRLSRILHG